jgi:hypothetical protein
MDKRREAPVEQAAEECYRYRHPDGLAWNELPEKTRRMWLIAVEGVRAWGEPTPPLPPEGQ